MRFNPAFPRVLDEVADGAIGDVRTVQAGFGFPPRRAGSTGGRTSAGGAARHGRVPAELAHLVMGVPDQRRGDRRVADDGLDVTASVFLRYGDGRFAHA